MRKLDIIIINLIWLNLFFRYGEQSHSQILSPLLPAILPPTFWHIGWWLIFQSPKFWDIMHLHVTKRKCQKIYEKSQTFEKRAPEHLMLWSIGKCTKSIMHRTKLYLSLICKTQIRNCTQKHIRQTVLQCGCSNACYGWSLGFGRDSVETF